MKKGMAYVGLQMLLIAGIFLSGPNYPEQVGLIALYCIGFLVGLWAVYTMRKSKLRVTPEVAEGSKLVRNGPYRYIRHPMYTSVILVTSSLVLDDFSVIRMFMQFALIAVLHMKLTYEEESLQKFFAEYKQYKKDTYRLLPYIY